MAANQLIVGVESLTIGTVTGQPIIGIASSTLQADAAVVLVKKYRIPTNAPDGTQRALYIWASANPLELPPLVDNVVVTASGGFFKHTDSTLVVGVSRPAALLGFGANATVQAFGGPCWASGIEE